MISHEALVMLVSKSSMMLGRATAIIVEFNGASIVARATVKTDNFS